jgi:hypothetical protein
VPDLLAAKCGARRARKEPQLASILLWRVNSTRERRSAAKTLGELPVHGKAQQNCGAKNN